MNKLQTIDKTQFLYQQTEVAQGESKELVLVKSGNVGDLENASMCAWMPAKSCCYMCVWDTTIYKYSVFSMGTQRSNIKFIPLSLGKVH